MVIVGVIGKSLGAHYNKMAGFDMIKLSPDITNDVKDGNITFYYDTFKRNVLYIHFLTTFDAQIMEQLLIERMTCATKNIDESLTSRHRLDCSFHTLIRARFSQMLLFAMHVCHIVVLVEPGNAFDTSYLGIFKALKVMR